MAKNYKVQHNHHVKRVGTRITQLKDVGRPRELIYVPKGLNRMKKPMTIQTTKQNPRNLTTQKRPPQVNLLPKNLSQKTNLATTPNT